MRINFTIENCIRETKWWAGFVVFVAADLAVIFTVDTLVRVLR